MATAYRLTGVVIFFCCRRGFGFIKREDAKRDVFVHYTAIVGRRNQFRSLRAGEQVEFSVRPGRKGNEAARVTRSYRSPAKSNMHVADYQRFRERWWDQPYYVTPEVYYVNQAPKAAHKKKRLTKQNRKKESKNKPDKANINSIEMFQRQERNLRLAESHMKDKQIKLDESERVKEMLTDLESKCSEINALQERMKKLEIALSDRDKSVEEVKRKLSESETQKDDLRQTITSLQVKLANLGTDDKVQKFEHELKQKDIIIADLTEQSGTSDCEKADQKNIIATLQTRLSEVKKANDYAVDSLEECLDEKFEEVRQQKDQIAKLEHDKAIVDKELKQYETDFVSLLERNSRLEDTIGQLQNKLSKKRNYGFSQKRGQAKHARGWSNENSDTDDSVYRYADKRRSWTKKSVSRDTKVKTIANIENNKPTDEEIRELLQKSIEKADLKVVSMRMIADEVYSKYPSLNVINKGDFIDGTIKSILMSMD